MYSMQLRDSLVGYFSGGAKRPLLAIMDTNNQPHPYLIVQYVHVPLVLLFATTRSVVKSVKVSVVEMNARMDLTGFRHRSSGDKSVGCVVQANRCRLVRLTPSACSPVIDCSVLTVAVRECIVVFG